MPNTSDPVNASTKCFSIISPRRTACFATTPVCPSDAAQALLVQTMFIAWLEDREIILPEEFTSASGGRARSFSDVLQSEDVDSLERLFRSLRGKFNGDLFVAPYSFEGNDCHRPLTPGHLNILHRFRSGREEMRGHVGQYRLWGYDFKYIPIELISAVYDRFLGENDVAAPRARRLLHPDVSCRYRDLPSLGHLVGHDEGDRPVPRPGLRLGRVSGAVVPAPV